MKTTRLRFLIKRLIQTIVPVFLLFIAVVVIFPNLLLDVRSYLEIEVSNSYKYYTQLDEPEGWKRVDLGSFTVDVPENFRYVRHNIQEGFHGEIVGNGIRMDFNYGYNIGVIFNLQENPKLSQYYNFSTDTLNSTLRTLARSKVDGYIMIQLEDISEDMFSDGYRVILGVEMSTTTKTHDRELVLRIFKTISLRN